MTSLFHFEDNFHRKSLTRAEATPLLFPRLLFQVLEHIGFPVKPRLEHYHDSEAILIVDQWRTRPHSFHLTPPKPAEDQPAADHPAEEQLPPTEHTKEHQVPASSISALATHTPLPTAPASSAPRDPSAPSHLRSISPFLLGTSWPSWMKFAPSLSLQHPLRLPIQPWLRG